jgi:hypothetical protein
MLGFRIIFEIQTLEFILIHDFYIVVLFLHFASFNEFYSIIMKEKNYKCIRL